MYLKPESSLRHLNLLLQGFHLSLMATTNASLGTPCRTVALPADPFFDAHVAHYLVEFEVTQVFHQFLFCFEED